MWLIISGIEMALCVVLLFCVFHYRKGYSKDKELEKNFESEKTILINRLDGEITRKIKQYEFLDILYQLQFQKIKAVMDNLKKEEEKKVNEYSSMISYMKQKHNDYKKVVLINIETEKSALEHKLGGEIARKAKQYEFLNVLYQAQFQKIKTEADKLKKEEVKKLGEYKSKELLHFQQDINNLRNAEERKLNEYRNDVLAHIEKEKEQAQNKLYQSIEKRYCYYKLLSIIVKVICQRIDVEVANLNTREQELLCREEKFKYYDKQLEDKLTLLNNLSTENNAAQQKLIQLKKEVNLYEMGFYETKYNFENSRKYAERLEEVRDIQKNLIISEGACICDNILSVIHSTSIGKSIINQYKELMLRAFNGECDSIISNVTYKNIGLMEKRIMSVYEFINESGKGLNCKITSEYFNLKKQELYLVFEYQEKLYQEKEEQRIIKEQIAEEDRAQKEFGKAIIEVEKEAFRYNKALAQVRKELERTTGNKVIELQKTINELEQKLQEAEDNKRAISQAQMTKSGCIYVISNIGSFGENVYKIGMTRRLDPSERIFELNGPSVPFKFDIHAMIFTKNAPELELKIHRRLAESRVNRVNLRKEFFEISLEEIEQVVKELGVSDVEFIHIHEAKEYRQSLVIKKEQLRHIS